MGDYENAWLTDQSLELLKQRSTAEFVAGKENGNQSHIVGFLHMTVKKQSRIHTSPQSRAV